MRTRHLRHFFTPESVAIVGASERPESFGGYVLRNLRAAGFAGPTLAVHPEGDALVHGVPRVSTLRDLPFPPDLAVLCNPPDSIPAEIRALGKAGVKAALVLFGGLPEETSAGSDSFQWARALFGRPLQSLREATLAAAAPYDMRIMGPNCMGIISPHCRLNASFSTLNLAPGETAFVGQCGMLGLAFADWAKGRGVGFSHLLTLGDGLDVDLADVLEYLGQDPATKVILLQAERFGEGGRFLSALRAAARNKVVIALKSGRAGTGEGPLEAVPDGLHDRDAVDEAVLRRAGVLRIERSDELIDAMASLARFRGLGGDRLAIIANGAGPGTLAADALVRGGGRLARLRPETLARLREILPAAWNGREPVDLQPDATPGRYRRAIRALGDDPEVDAILAVLVPTGFAPPVEVAQAVIAARDEVRQPLCASWMGEGTVASARDLLHGAGVPSFDTPEQAVASFMLYVRFRRAQTALRQTPRFLPEATPPDPERVAALLAAGKHRGSLTDAELLQLLHAYGVVDRVHGGVGTPDEPVLGFGITRDAIFGPLVLFGEGGRSWRRPALRAVGLPPLNHTLAGLVVESSAFGRDILARADGEAVFELACRSLVRLSHLVIEVPVIRRLEMEAVPLGGEVQLAGARVELGAPAETAIAPYPEALRETVSLRDGREVELRPIRGEDEPKHAEFLAGLSPATIRNRLFAPRSRISHEDLARLTQIDYAREMAFVAEARTATGDTEILGVARSTTDADNVSAEFAIVVRDDVSGMGLGRALLEKLVRYSRGRGTLELYGFTLPGNARMQALADRLGFASELDLRENIVHLVLPLNTPRSDWQRERLQRR
jgi:acyl-CoA synthetase (NDP forming)/RimJ/RimL family protein N-acetyltransferase